MFAGKQRKDTSPRKVPIQKRSRDNVERILKAAAAVLEEEGYDQLKTVTIAERAGASIGSVYQYFPNKHAILTQLVERWLAADNKALEEVESRRDQYDTVVDQFLDLTDIVIANYKEQKALMAIVALCRNIPELRDMERAHDKQYAHRIAKILEQRKLSCAAEERSVVAAYFTIIVDATAISIARERHEERAQLKAKILKNSIKDLFQPYL